jgi:hypothetical protein
VTLVNAEWELLVDCDFQDAPTGTPEEWLPRPCVMDGGDEHDEAAPAALDSSAARQR